VYSLLISLLGGSSEGGDCRRNKGQNPRIFGLTAGARYLRVHAVYLGVQ
jgi:hypothetical protein